MTESAYDVVIIGSSFTGSLLGWILAKQGRRVMIIDRSQHPRFAIGESSTPTSDFLLAHIADRWSLPELAPLACWGTWKQTYPEITCGKKRGFSYYRHYPHQAYHDDEQHSQSLLVAASVEDRWSDTHWLRSEVDHFFAKRAVAAGAELYELSELQSAQFDPHTKRWKVAVRSPDAERVADCPWLVDASGVGGALSPWIDNPRDDEWMRTKTGTVFAHFRDVVRFDDELHSAIHDPHRLFSGDDAAQHHVLDNGWYWMLRMDNGVTSVGVVLPSNDLPNETEFQSQDIRWRWWRQLLEEYPSIGDIMRSAEWVAPPPGLLFTQRMSRCRQRATGPGWVLLPTSYGFIDPLHSTGIAHGLSGVARLAEILLGPDDAQTIRMQEYGKQLRTEIEWLDTIVGGCYQGLPSFARFAAYSCYYFTAAIQFERQMATDPNRWSHGYFMSELSGLRSAAEESYRTLVQQPHLDEQAFVDQVRRSIAPWNHVGLLEPTLKNRLAHTSAPKYVTAGFV